MYKKVFLCFFLCVYSFLGLASHQIPEFKLCPAEDEGFLWKENFKFVLEGDSRSQRKEITLDEQHHELYGTIKNFKDTLKAFPDLEIIGVIKRVVTGLRFSDPNYDELMNIFKNLKGKGNEPQEQKIETVMRKYSLNFDNVFENECIHAIILENVRQLTKVRNLCTASFSVMNKDDLAQEIKHEMLTLNGRPIIFFSGVTNQLLRILEMTPQFQYWSYVIFERYGRKFTLSKALHTDPLPKETTLLKNLNESAEHGYKNIQDSCLQRKAQSYYNHLSSLANDINEHDYSLAASRNSALQHAIPELLDSYSHSEQALRLFLFSHIDTLLAGKISASDILILNIHTERDPCENCTHFLFLETHMHDKNPRLHYLPYQEGEIEVFEARGFFQKLNFVNLPGCEEPLFPQSQIPSPYILVSASRLESKGGLNRRLTSGLQDEEAFTSQIDLETPGRLFFRYNGPFPHPYFCQEAASNSQAPQLKRARTQAMTDLF